MCKKEFLSHPYALTPALLAVHRMYFAIYALDLDISSDTESTKSRVS